LKASPKQPAQPVLSMGKKESKQIHFCFLCGVLLEKRIFGRIGVEAAG